MAMVFITNIGMARNGFRLNSKNISVRCADVEATRARLFSTHTKMTMTSREAVWACYFSEVTPLLQ